MEDQNKQNQTKYRFGGAIPLLRKFQQDPFWTERRKFSRAEAWIDLLFMARYGTETEEIWNRDELIPIRYAQILTSVVTLARKWKRSRAWVKNFINVLEKKQSISIITMDNRRTILEIVNMDKIKELLQNNEQQTLHQTEQHKSSRKTYKDKDNKVNKEIIKRKPRINGLLSLFAKVNPSYERLFANMTERAALERMIAKYGEDKLFNLISHLSEIVSRPYAPRITTPYELELKMGKLLLFLRQEKNNDQKGGVTKV